MELQHLLEWLLNQAAVVVVMGVVIYFQQKEKMKLVDKIELLIKEHRTEVRELRDHSARKDLEQLEALNAVSTLLDRVSDSQGANLEFTKETKETVLGKFEDLKNWIINGKINNNGAG